MQAKKCDRCGTFYEAASTKPKLALTTHSNTTSRYIKTIDLCLSCEESLAVWFNEYREEKKCTLQTIKE
jgi:hypothetical protein